MNLLDFILVIPLIWFAWRGFMKGLIIELATLAVLFTGIYFGVWLSGIVASFLKDSFDMTSRWVPVIAYTVTFILIIITVFALAKMLEKSVNLLALGLFNKLLGAFFGLLKMLLLLSLALYIIEKTDWIPEKTKNESLLYKPVSDIAPAVISVLKTETSIPAANQKKD